MKIKYPKTRTASGEAGRIRFAMRQLVRDTFKKSGLSKKDFAEKCEIGQGALNKWLRHGFIHMDSAIQFCIANDIDTEDLFKQVKR